MEKRIEFTIVRSHRRSISLHILSGGQLEVRAPHLMPKFLITQFVERQAEWIEKKKEVEKHSPRKRKQYIEGEAFLHLGTPRVLTFGQHPSIAVEDTKLFVPQFLQFRIEKELTDWYRKEAKKIITERVTFQAQSMPASYKSITFSDTISKWGSCTHDNRLQFNWRLVMAPLLVINYVVVHELVHTTVKNHSAAFWRGVANVTPSYKQHIKWLKAHGDELMEGRRVL